MSYTTHILTKLTDLQDNISTELLAFLKSYETLNKDIEELRHFVSTHIKMENDDD